MSDIPGLDRLVAPDPGLLGRDFVIVHVIPAATGMASVLMLLLAGVPGAAPSSRTLVEHLIGLDASDLGMVLVSAVGAAFVLAPLSGATESFVEGGWSTWWGLRWFAAWRVERHRKRNERAGIRKTWEQTPDRVKRARWAEIHDREYPWYDLDLAGTRYGNARRSLADRVDRAYGATPISEVAGPDPNGRFRDHLLTLKSEEHPIAEMIDEANIRIDAATSFVTVWIVVTVTWVGLLAYQPAWLPLALVPAILAVLAYAGAVRLTVAYSYLLDDVGRLVSSPPPPIPTDVAHRM